MEKEQPESPQEPPAHGQPHRGSFHTLARRQVINSWSLSPSRGIGWGGPDASLPLCAPPPTSWAPGAYQTRSTGPEADF